MRILIIGDSLAMPRNDCSYDDTWCYKLRVKYDEYDFVEKNKRASSVRRLVEEGGGYGNVVAGADLLEYYRPDIVITHFGIADCAPRLLKESSVFTKLIRRMPPVFTKPYIKFLQKHRGRRIENANVSIDEWSRCWNLYVERATKLGVRIIYIEIGVVQDSVLQRSPYLGNCIYKYNKVLNDLAKDNSNIYTLTPFSKDEIDEVAFSDGYHIRSEGHNIIFKKLNALIDKIKNEK